MKSDGEHRAQGEHASSPSLHRAGTRAGVPAHFCRSCWVRQKFPWGFPFPCPWDKAEFVLGLQPPPALSPALSRLSPPRSSLSSAASRQLAHGVFKELPFLKLLFVSL